MAALVILLLLLLTVLGLCLKGYRFTFYNPASRRIDPYELPPGEAYQKHKEETFRLIRELEALPCEEVSILSRDGLRLFGRYYHAADGAPLQILVHGYRGDALRDFCGGSKIAREAGMNTLLVDQRAHGRSEGKTICFGVEERWDCLAWANYAAERFGPDCRISLAGISMGAATVLMASDLPLPENVKAIIADCPYTSPRAIIREVSRTMPWFFHLLYPFAGLCAGLFGGFDLDGASPLGAVSNTRLPILLIHGESDGFIPCRMSKELASACAGPVRLELFPGADHGMCYLEDPERYRSLVLDFLRETGVLE